MHSHDGQPRGGAPARRDLVAVLGLPRAHAGRHHDVDPAILRNLSSGPTPGDLGIGDAEREVMMPDHGQLHHTPHTTRSSIRHVVLLVCLSLVVQASYYAAVEPCMKKKAAHGAISRVRAT